MKRILLFCAVIFCFAYVQAQTDSVQTEGEFADTLLQERAFRPRQLVAPVVLIGLGAWGLAENSPVDILAHKARNDMNPNWHKCHADEVLQYTPSGVHLVLGFIPGVKAKHNFLDRAIASATAHALTVATTKGIKNVVHEKRPDSSKENSFFSGHTATAFTGAELVRIEYGWGYGSAAYAMAITTGFLRVYNKRHWVGDVLAGAGTGILCANAGYWMLPVWKRWFRLDKKKKGSTPTLVATPFYQQEDKAAGLSCSILL